MWGFALHHALSMILHILKHFHSHSSCALVWISWWVGWTWHRPLPPRSVWFHTGKISSQTRSIYKKKNKTCFLQGYVTSFKTDQQNLHLLVIAANWAFKALQGNILCTERTKHKAAWCGVCFNPTMRKARSTLGRNEFGSLLYHKKKNAPEFLCKWTQTLSSRRSCSGSFDLHSGSIGTFTPVQTNSTNDESVSWLLSRERSRGPILVTFLWKKKSSVTSK